MPRLNEDERLPMLDLHLAHWGQANALPGGPIVLPILIAFTILTSTVVTHAEPVELKQHRDARAKQVLQAALNRPDASLEWRLKRFDANRDGVLDRKELAVEQTAKDKQINEAAKRLDQRESARRQQGDLHRFDRNKNGRLDPAERVAQRQHEDKLKLDLLKKHDTNKNGKLDPDELKPAPK